jgi:hypothetical protein
MNEYTAWSIMWICVAGCVATYIYSVVPLGGFSCSWFQRILFREATPNKLGLKMKTLKIHIVANTGVNEHSSCCRERIFPA